MVYHYTSSGLDDVYLENGVRIEDTPYGAAVAIEDSDGLHRAIGRWLIERPSPLNGAELRFLRIQMDMTQRGLAGVIGGTEQTLRLWEKGRSKSIPGTPDRLVRALFAEALGGSHRIRRMLERLADLDQLEHADKCFERVQGTWRPRHSPGVPSEVPPSGADLVEA